MTTKEPNTFDALSQETIAMQQAADETTPPETLRTLAETNLTLKQIVAQNPAAPADLLTKLASDRNKITQKAVASNPNTPTEILMKLGVKFPQEFLNNPIFELLLLENPNFILAMPVETLKSILKLKELPEYILILASQHLDKKVVLAVANNPLTSRAILERLSESPHQKVADAAKLHVNYPTEITEEMILLPSVVLGPFLKKSQLGTDYNYEMRLGFIEAIPLFLLSLITFEARLTLAGNFRIPLSYLEVLAKDAEFQVRAEVAKNPNTTITMLRDLAKTQSLNVRLGLASNPNTPLDILEGLAKSKSEILLFQLASNPTTPVTILEKLGHTINSLLIRRVLANNPSTPLSLKQELSVYLPEDLEILGKHKKSAVRQWVASNLDTPESVLETLAQDWDLDVQRQVAKNPKTPKSVLRTLFQSSDDDWILAELASNINTPINFLKTLAQHPWESIRERVIINPKTPVSVLETLAKTEESLSVLRALDESPRLAPQLKEEFAKYLAKDVAINPHTPESILETQVSETLASVLKTSADPSRYQIYRLAALLHPQTPPKMLSKNSSSSSWMERYAVAQNVNTPSETLNYMLEDSNRLVRAAACANLDRK